MKRIVLLTTAMIASAVMGGCGNVPAAQGGGAVTPPFIAKAVTRCFPGFGSQRELSVSTLIFDPLTGLGTVNLSGDPTYVTLGCTTLSWTISVNDPIEFTGPGIDFSPKPLPPGSYPFTYGAKRASLWVADISAVDEWKYTIYLRTTVGPMTKWACDPRVIATGSKEDPRAVAAASSSETRTTVSPSVVIACKIILI